MLYEISRYNAHYLSISCAYTVTYSRERQDVLAQPKRLPPAFLEDRRSVYWVDKQPETGPTKFGNTFGLISTVITVVEMYNDLSALTKRQEELVQHKKPVPSFVPDRFSPMWQVSLSAMQATPSKRICQLAKHKPFHRDWIAMRSYDTHIPHPALRTAASERFDKVSENIVITRLVITVNESVLLNRLEILAQPKTYQPLPIKSNSEWDWGEWAPAIPKEAKNHVASARLEQLAEPRSCPENYLENRSTVWPVAKTAMQMQVSA